eukprot:gene1171-1279_t
MEGSSIQATSLERKGPEERDTLEEPEDLTLLTAIQNRYAFWYRCDLGEKGKVQKHNYSESIKKIASFQSVERFWSIYDFLKRPHEFKNAEFHLFKDGIRPFWEDNNNKDGGKWSVRLPKGIAGRYWEDILLAIIGEQFDVGYEICGAVVSVRSNEDIISVWNKTADNKEAVEKIRDQIRKFVRLPHTIPIEYKRHQISLEEGSSYKNPTMVWRPPVKTGNYHHFGHHNSGNAPFEKGPHGESKPYHYRSNYHGYHNNNNSNNGAPAEGDSAPSTHTRPWKTGGSRWDNNNNSNNNNNEQQGFNSQPWRKNPRPYTSGEDGQHDTHDNAGDSSHAQPVNKPVSSAPDVASNPSTASNSGSVPPLQNLKRLSNPFA